MSVFFERDTIVQKICLARALICVDIGTYLSAYYMRIMRHIHKSEFIAAQMLSIVSLEPEIYVPKSLANHMQHYSFAKYFNKSMKMHNDSCKCTEVILRIWYRKNKFRICVQLHYCYDTNDDTWDKFNDSNFPLSVNEAREFLGILFDNGVKLVIATDNCGVQSLFFIYHILSQ